MARVKVKVENSIERALRQFKRRCIDAGIFAEIKRVSFYEKPSEERRRAEQQREKTIKKFARIHTRMRMRRRGAARRPSKTGRFGKRPPPRRR